MSVRDFVEQVDELVLDRGFQPIVNIAGSILRMSQFTLVRICLASWTAYAIWLGWKAVRGFDYDIAACVITVLCVVSVMEQSHSLWLRINRALLRTGANINRVALRVQRVLSFWFILLNLIIPYTPWKGFMYLLIGFMAFPTCAMFFGSCEGARPKADRVYDQT